VCLGVLKEGFGGGIAEMVISPPGLPEVITGLPYGHCWFALSHYWVEMRHRQTNFWVIAGLL
jgi:hypothetical protein